jgi:hypothetical protein
MFQCVKIMTTTNDVKQINATFLTFDAKKRASYIRNARTRIAYKKCNNDKRVIDIRIEYAKNASKNEIIDMINAMLTIDKNAKSNDAIENELLNM